MPLVVTKSLLKDPTEVERYGTMKPALRFLGVLFFLMTFGQVGHSLGSNCSSRGLSFFFMIFWLVDFYVRGQLAYCWLMTGGLKPQALSRVKIAVFNLFLVPRCLCSESVAGGSLNSC